MPKLKKEYKRLIFALSSLGIEMVASIVVGYFIGKYLDKVFDTGNTLTMLFLLLGVVAGFRSLVVAAKRVQKDIREHKLDNVYENNKSSEK